jgi:hypothetical protein
MKNYTSHLFKSLFDFIEKPCTAVCLTIGLSLVGTLSAVSHESSNVASVNGSSHAQESTPLTVSQHMPDGTYLYGQSTEADQVGSAYMVLDVEGDRIVGAFYMPQSSFDCFYGEVQPRQLALNIIDSYERDVYPYQVAVDQTGAVASASGEAVPPTIEGFYQLEELGALDRHVLEACRADIQDLN